MAVSEDRKVSAAERWLARIDPGTPGTLSARLRPAVFLLILGFLLFMFLMPLFKAPFERDQGTYATIARGWMQGSIPYVDLWDNKGPLLFLWYILSFKWLGTNIAAPRIVAAIAAALCLPFVWAAARSLFGRGKAALTALLFAFCFLNLYLEVTANSEIFMLLPLTAGFWAFVRGTERNSLWWTAAAGMLTSLAVFTRQSAILTFAGYGLWICIIRIRCPEERRHQTARLFALAAGGILGALPFAAYFAAKGALYDLWFGMFGFNLGWAAEQSFWLKLVPPMFIEPAPLAGGLVFWIPAAMGVWRLVRRGDRQAWLVLSFLAVSEAAAQIMGKGSAHYSIQLLPGAAVAASFGLPFLLDRWKGGSRGLRVALAAAISINAAAVLLAYCMPTAEGRFMVQYTFRDYAHDAIDALPIAAAVASRSSPGDCVYEWGRSSQIYFLSNRQPCSRLFYNRPYEVDRSVTNEIMKDLRKNEPAVILITAEIPPPPELEAFIRERFRYACRVNYATLYKLVEKNVQKI